MVVVKEQHGQETKWQRYKDPPDIKVPEVNNPSARLRRLESLGDRHKGNVSTLETAWYVGKPHPEERRKHICVVSKEATEPWLPENTAPELFDTVN